MGISVIPLNFAWDRPNQMELRELRWFLATSEVTGNVIAAQVHPSNQLQVSPQHACEGFSQPRGHFFRTKCRTWWRTCRSTLQHAASQQATVRFWNSYPRPLSGLPFEIGSFFKCVPMSCSSETLVSSMVWVISWYDESASSPSMERSTSFSEESDSITSKIPTMEIPTPPEVSWTSRTSWLWTKASHYTPNECPSASCLSAIHRFLTSVRVVHMINSCADETPMFAAPLCLTSQRLIQAWMRADNPSSRLPWRTQLATCRSSQWRNSSFTLTKWILAKSHQISWQPIHLQQNHPSWQDVSP